MIFWWLDPWAVFLGFDMIRKFVSSFCGGQGTLVFLGSVLEISEFARKQLADPFLHQALLSMELGVPLLAMVLQFIIVFLLLSGLKVVSFSLIPSSSSSPCLLVWSYKAYTSVICGCCRDANISLDLDYFQRMSDADSVVYGAVKSIPGITTHFEEPEKINMCRLGHLNEKQSNKLIVSSSLEPHARRLIHTCPRVGLS